MNIKLLNTKWKYYAQDADGREYLYSEEPRVSGQYWYANNYVEFPSGMGRILPKMEDWKDSVCEVMPDGTLQKMRKVPPEDTLVWVKGLGDDWMPRYSTGRSNQRGSIICYSDGCTSVTANGRTRGYQVWKPYCPWDE